MRQLKFTKVTLDNLLNEILDTYFDDNNTMLLHECIDFVKDAYKDEISTLKNGPIWTSGEKQ